MRKEFILALALLGPTAVQAQNDTAAARTAALRALQPGSLLRIESTRGRTVGPLISVRRDTLHLEIAAIPLRTIHDAWIRRRATTRGLKIGALTGAAAGALAATGLLTFFAQFCEYECEDVNAGSLASWGLRGAAYGGLVGGGIGTIIGASTSYWARLTEGRVGEAIVMDRAPLRQNAATATPAITLPVESDGSGIGLRASYLFQTSRLAIGPELGYYTLGNRARGLPFDCGKANTEPCTSTYPATEYVATAGAVSRLGTGRDRTFELYGTAGAGAYLWGTDARDLPRSAGYTVGAGAELRSRNGWRGIFLEARWQAPLGDVDGEYDYGFYTLGLGGKLAW